MSIKKRGKKKRGRFAPAFILLMIATEPTHGLGILQKMDTLVPTHRLDTAVIYRSLKEFEEMGCITSDWTDSEAGPKKKVYSLTSKGREVLSEFKDEVEHSLNNLQIFIKQYDGLEEN